MNQAISRAGGSSPALMFGQSRGEREGNPWGALVQSQRKVHPPHLQAPLLSP